MWTRVWLLLGRESEIPNPGDWQREDVGPESILMVRQQDGGVKAFYNVCQHRGNRLVHEERGSVRRFVCKYHSWGLPAGWGAQLRPGRPTIFRKATPAAGCAWSPCPARPSPASFG